MALKLCCGINVLTQSPSCPLQATYYNDVFMRVPAKSILLDAVDGSWGFDAPATTVNPDFFSIRWAGKMSTSLTGTYALHLYADDCATLWLEGSRVLDSCESDVGVKVGTIPSVVL